MTSPAGRMPSRWQPVGLLLAPALVVLVINAFTPVAALSPQQVDVLIYLHKAQALAHGGLPYRDFPFEYPPLALVAMAVPYLAWPIPGMDLETYRWLFAAWEGLLLIALVLVAARIAGHLTPSGADRENAARWVAIRLLILAIVAAPSLAWRYDLFPALLALVAVWLAIEGRASWAGVFIGLGFVAKVFPVVLIPALGAIWLVPLDRRRLVAFVAGIAASASAVMLPVVLSVGDSAWGFVNYQADRGLQLETVPAGLILLQRLWSSTPVPLTFDFGSVQVAGGAASAYLVVQTWLTLIAFAAMTVLAVALARREWRATGGMRARTVVGLATAFVLLLLVTNKVYSVQYFVWLLPLAAFLPRRQFWLAVVIGALSVGIHPLFYKALVAQDLAAVLLLNARNVLVVALLVWVVAWLVRGDSQPSTTRLATADLR